MEGFREFITKAFNEGFGYRPGGTPPVDDAAVQSAIDSIVGNRGIKHLFQRPDFMNNFGNEQNLRKMMAAYARTGRNGEAIEMMLGPSFAHDTPDEAGRTPILWLLRKPSALGAGPAKHTGAEIYTPSNPPTD